MVDTIRGVAIAFVVFTAYIGVCVKLGVMPTRGFRLYRRADNPDEFNAAVTILCVFIYGSMVIGLFVGWAEWNSQRLLDLAN